MRLLVIILSLLVFACTTTKMQPKMVNVTIIKDEQIKQLNVDVYKKRNKKCGKLCP